MKTQDANKISTSNKISCIGILLAAGMLISCGGNADSQVESTKSIQNMDAETEMGEEAGIKIPAESPAEDSIVITLGTLEENYDLNDMASRFHELHPEYRIEVKVYGSGMYGDMDGLNDLRMEIVSGAGPDLINFGSHYSNSFAAGGITLDLSSYLEEEGIMEEEKYFTNILDAARMGEEIKVVFPSFSLVSFVGKESLLEGRKNWDIEEMKDCYLAMPEGTVLFMGDDKGSVFAFLCTRTMDSFVDWSSGTCNFTDDRFVDMLTFTDCFSEKLMLDEDYSCTAYYAQGKALLYPCTVEDVYAVTLADALMGEKTIFIGYPIDKAAGKQSGNLIQPGQIVLGIGANSGYKEEAWEYIKMFFEEEYQSTINGEFPVSRSELEKRLLQAQTPEMIVDEEGNSMEAVQAEMGFEGEARIQVTAITPEQGERLIEIIESADSTSATDREMYFIALEEFEMFLSGDRSAEDTAEVIQRRLSMYVGEKQ